MFLKESNYTDNIQKVTVQTLKMYFEISTT